jgi:hypothetical protein
MFYASDLQVAKAIHQEREEAARHYRLIRAALAASNKASSPSSRLSRWHHSLRRVFHLRTHDQQQLACC